MGSFKKISVIAIIMLDITVIILTYNEQLHLRRCIECVLPIVQEVYVVDSFSTDGTELIAESFGVNVVQHKWPGLYAPQFNWALENLPIRTKWVLRLDADEYLTEELLRELWENLNKLGDDVTGVVFKRRHIFLGKWIKKGTYPIKLLRLFQYRRAICEQRMMDEHIQLLDGRSVEFEYDFVDHNLSDIGWWTSKHNGYALREAVDLLNIEFGLDVMNRQGEARTQKVRDVALGEQATSKRIKKVKYARMPLFWRAFAYFCFRYFLKGGFLEGKEGFLWHFLQGWWYRTLVDAKTLEIKRSASQKGGVTAENILRVLRDEYGMKI
jgi:glycosyltransferase involved in cell wall biosynthesis